MRTPLPRLSLLTLTLALSGCFAMPERSMDAQIEFSGAYIHTLEQGKTHAQGEWWHAYNDPELNIIMATAFRNNPNLNQIRARLDQAKAVARITDADLLPSVTANGERSTQNGNSPAKGSSEYGLGGMASYELDLWGKNRASSRADNLTAQASAEDVHAAKITLGASVVENWLDILSLLEQEQIIRAQIKSNRDALELQQKRFSFGSARALDILQQQQALARAEAQLPDILSNQKIAANNIALLIGKTPSQKLQISAKPMPEILPLPASGIPSDLLANRPDILAAWLRLLSADWSTKAAWANRLPSFNLSANYATSATALSALFDTWLLDLAASFTAPIFDGGSRKAEQWRQDAIADERFHAYRETVLTAVTDVENALVRNRYQDEKIAALNVQLNAARKTLEQAQFSYAGGESTYINVLSAITDVQSLELQIAQEKLLQAKERVRLYRVLGGRSWAIQQETEDQNDGQ